MSRLEARGQHLSSSRCRNETRQIDTFGRPSNSRDFADGLATWRGGDGQQKTQAVRRRRIMWRHAARQISIVPLSYAGGARLSVFGLFSAAVCTKNGELKAAAGLFFFERTSDGHETETLVDREHSF